MNMRKIASLSLAVALQVLPITRVFVASSPVAGSSYAIVSTWIAGALALMGGLDAVSGASSLLISPNTATTGVAYSGIVQYSGGHASSVRSWELKNNWSGAKSGCNSVYEIAPGLWLTNAATYLARVGGTPTASGTFSFTMKIWDAAGCSGGNSDTRTASITINAGTASAPSITTQPVSQTVTAGANVSFTVVATGTAPLSYQWKLNGVNVSGATSATLNLTSVTTGQAGSYTCTVTNTAGSVNSSAATLTVNAAAVAPSITTQPVSQTVTAGANVSFTVVANGTGPLNYQWKLNGVNISGATSATLSLSGVTTGQAGSYTCQVTNVAGSATSSVALLTVNPAVVAPTITTQPVGQSVMEGTSVSFAVTASGTAPLSYQWRLNGVNIGGATSATLSLSSVTTNQAGNYTCMVTNVAGAVNSSAALLTVTTLPVAPTITTQPGNQVTAVGGSVSFAVAASGTSPFNYQWRLNGANLPGATAATLVLTGVTTNQAGSYTCVVTNVAGSATSSAAVLTVNVPPTITSQPVSQTVTAGTNVSFTVAAIGTAPLSYQWRLSGINISGAVSATLNLTAVTVGQAGSYTCLVSNVAGTVTSGAATLTVNAAPIAPAITLHPVSQSVTAGANVSLTVAASGTAPLSYQWQKNGVNVSGGTGATLLLTGVTTNQAGNYACIVTNLAGSAISSTASLTVNPAPVAPAIISQPASQTVTSGANVSFTVTASGTAPLSYQWRRNGVNLVGATAATLSLANVTTNSAGTYQCVVTNAAGSVTSSGAVLIVQPVAQQATTLTLIIQGQGTVTPNLNSASLILGQTYTMTATPANGYEFAGWSGNVQAVQSSAASLTFVMASNLVLQASFIPTPYTAGAGTYNGLFFEGDEIRVSSAGAFKVSADGNGNYSGWLQSGYTRHAISGKLDLGLRATNVIARWNSTPLTVELLIGQGDLAGEISGRVTDGGWTSVLSGGRTTGNSIYAGKYTLVIPGSVGDPHIPAGDGYATLSVGVDGTATMNGTLADGTQFMQSAMVTDDGDWPVYVSLYLAKGAVVSWMRFANLSGSDVSGPLVWIKQAGASVASHPAGFTNETKAVGSLYVVPPTTGKALNLSGAGVGFSGGDLTANFSNQVSVNAGSLVVNLSPNILTLTISPTLGSFTGQVAVPGSGVMHPFAGVVLQKPNAGYGFLTGDRSSSRVVIAAP